MQRQLSISQYCGLYLIYLTLIYIRCGLTWLGFMDVGFVQYRIESICINIPGHFELVTYYWY